MTFRVHDLRGRKAGGTRGDVADYLSVSLRRLHNTMHAETRVYTCRSWRASGGAIETYELGWNGDDVPGETLLGRYSHASEPGLVGRIEAEFARGEAVRLFIFNSDADLVFEEVLEPVP